MKISKQNEVTPSVVRVPIDVLEDVTNKIFRKAGCSYEQAQVISLGLVDADKSGHPSHGVIRTTRYLKWLSEKKLVADQTPVIQDDGGSMIRIDGRRGFGQTMGGHSVRLGCARAKSDGLALVSLCQSGHLGRIGKWAEDAAAEGITSIHFVCVRGHPLVAPFGGSKRMMSTAPIAIGFPTADGTSIVHDFSTASIAEGKVLLSAKSGKKLAGNFLIDPKGTLTNDPNSLYGKPKKNGEPLMPSEGAAAIRAFGDHKGSGLAMMCELLAGVLTNSGVTDQDTTPGDVWSGMLSIYISADSLNGNLANEVDAYVERMRASTSIDPAVQVRAPGDVEKNAREVSKISGVELPTEVWRELESELSEDA